MSNRKSITDFKDLRNAIEEIQKNQPAQTRYQQQAEKMGYRQEAEKKKKKWKEPLKGYPGNESVSEAKFSPALIKQAIEIANSLKYQDYYSGAYKAIAKLKKGLEDDPKVLAALKAANEGVVKDVKEDIPTTEESEKQAKYKAFFMKALKKFGVKSPAELKGDDKSKFFDYVDKNYEADNEEDSEEEVD